MSSKLTAMWVLYDKLIWRKFAFAVCVWWPLLAPCGGVGVGVQQGMTDRQILAREMREYLFEYVLQQLQVLNNMAITLKL